MHNKKKYKHAEHSPRNEPIEWHVEKASFPERKNCENKSDIGKAPGKMFPEQVMDDIKREWATKI